MDVTEPKMDVWEPNMDVTERVKYILEINKKLHVFRNVNISITFFYSVQDSVLDFLY